MLVFAVAHVAHIDVIDPRDRELGLARYPARDAVVVFGVISLPELDGGHAKLTADVDVQSAVVDSRRQVAGQAAMMSRAPDLCVIDVGGQAFVIFDTVVQHRLARDFPDFREGNQAAGVDVVVELGRICRRGAAFWLFLDQTESRRCELLGGGFVGLWCGRRGRADGCVEGSA